MTPRSPIFLTDIGQVEMDQTCGMRYWMNHYEGGTGILKRDTVIDLLLDTEVHNDLRTLASMPDIDPLSVQAVISEVLSHLTAADKQDVKKMELLYRRLGWFAAFAMFIEPDIRHEFDTMPSDPAMVLDRDPLFVVSYPDRLLLRKGTGEIILREYVPMPPGLTADKWLKSWHYNIRLHVAIAAALDMDIKIASAEVVGMARGFYSLLDNRLVHPYVWGYLNKATQEWSPTKPDNMRGSWDIAPVWEFGGGVVSWVRMCGERVARSQFHTSPSVFLNKDILDAWIAARVHRERSIREVVAVATTNHHLRNVYFPRVTNHCEPANGDSCPYRDACWDKQISLMPLKSSSYIKNDPSKLGELIP
jgi:hypothetical protein